MEYRVFIADTEYGTDSIESVSIEYPTFDKLSIGNACSAQLNMTFWPYEGAEIPRMAKIVPEARERGAVDWVQLGVFFIDERQLGSGGKMSIVAYDSMLKTEQKWDPGATATIWSTQKLSSDNGMSVSRDIIYSKLLVGESYTVVFDGVAYIRECYSASSLMGTTKNLGSKQNGDPFVVSAHRSGSAMNGTVVEFEPGTHTIYITEGNEFPMTMKNAVEALAAVVEIEVDEDSISILSESEYEVDYPVSDQTIRQTFAWIAAAYSANWIITKDDVLSLVPLLRGENQNHDLGKTVTRFEYDSTPLTITGLSLIVDDESEHFAGNKTGYVLEAECPYATEDMVSAALALVSGKTYTGFKASGAKLPVSAKRGDSITIDGKSFLLVNQTLRFGPGHVSDIEAPMYEEVDHEYKYESPTKRAFNRKIAENRSLITKTASEIRMEVANVDGRVSNLSLTVDGLSTRVETAEGNVSSLSQTVSGFEARVSNAETGLSQTLRLGADGVTITNAEGSSLKIDGGQINADNLQVKAANVSGTLSANSINLLGDLDVYDYYGQLGGHLGYTPSSLDGSPAIHMAKGSAEIAVSEYAAKINYNGYAQIYVGPNPDTQQGIAVIASGYDEVRFQHDYTGRRGFYPNHNEIHLGLATLPWGAIYSKDGTIQQSDANVKNSIEELPEKYLDMFDELSPVRFKLNEGTSGHYHVGFISQEVEEAMDAAGVGSLEFAGFIKDKDTAGNDIYMLRYNEFIGILTAKVKQLEGRIKNLEG